AVLLIGTGEAEPALIFEGNHRLTAALLSSPTAFQRFRMYFGRSPLMDRCCWYRSRLSNLVRYIINRIMHLGYDREADVERVLAELEKQRLPGLAAPVAVESESAPTNLS